MQEILTTLSLIQNQDQLLFDFLTLNFKASLISLVSVFWLFQLRFSAPSRRHLIATITFFMLALLPFISIIVPSTSVGVLPPPPGMEVTNLLAVSTNAQQPVNLSASHSNPTNLLVLAALAYLIVTAVMLLRIALSLYRSWRLSRGSQIFSNQVWSESSRMIAKEYGVKRRMRLRHHAHIHCPITLGLFRPIIVVPSLSIGWNSQRVENILRHEIGHIKRLDWGTVVLVNTVIALFWWNPVVWMLKKQLMQDIELAVDDLVVKPGRAAATYAELLLDSTNHQSRLSGVHLSLIETSGMYSRIKRVLEIHDREPFSKLATGLIMSASLVSMGVIASVQATVIPPKGINHLIDSLGITLTNIETKNPEISHPLQSIHKPKKPEMQKAPASKRSILKMEHLVVVAVPEASSIAAVTVDFEVSDSLALIKLEGAMPIESVNPIYPRWALLAEMEGQVTVGFDINSNGIAENIRIVHSDPENVFDRAVLQAVSKSRYQPLIQAGSTVTLRNMRSRYLFKLDPPEQKPSKSATMIAKLDSS